MITPPNGGAMETRQTTNLRDPENAPLLKPAFVASHEGDARWCGGGLAVIRRARPTPAGR